MSETAPQTEKTGVVGIIGGGQLALMLAQSAKKLGIDCIALDPDPACCASAACEVLVAKYDDENALRTLAERCAVVTYEFENVPVRGVRTITDLVPVRPDPVALETAQDRLSERAMFEKLGIATPGFARVSDEEELARAIEKVGTPSILKTRRLGYDGKGQARLRRAEDAHEAWRSVGGAPSILDQMVDFTRELSIVATRALDGSVVCHPLVENEHTHGILLVTRAPAMGVPEAIQNRAREDVTKILEELNYVGTIALEYFQIGEGDDARLLANEIAPRVHNTGHWTIEGARTSQFENHIRAVAGLELGDPGAKTPSAMVNIIGALPKGEDLASLTGAHVHLYGKSPRPGRKLGHITITDPDRSTVDSVVGHCLSAIENVIAEV